MRSRRHLSSRATATARVARVQSVQSAAVDVVIRIAILSASALIFLVATAMRAAAATQDTQEPVSNTRRAAGVGDSAAADLAMAPSPALAPDEVVGIVLTALSRNDSPVKDHGISVTFGFASPANRAFVGPVESFGDLVRDDAYRPLLYHRAAARGVPHVTGDRATVRVVITTATGQRVAYLFALSLQAEGQYKGCWMTDGVTREPPSPLSGMRFASQSAPGAAEWLARS